MNREDFLVMTAFLLMLEGYLASNVLPGVVGLAVLLYILLVRSSTVFALKASPHLPSGPLETGREYWFDVTVSNGGSAVRLRPRVLARGLEVRAGDLFVGPGDEATLSGRLEPLEKGEVSVESMTLVAEDERGLYFDELPVVSGVTFRAYPSLREIEEAARVDRNLRLVELYKTGHFFGSEGLDFKDLREYQHGDDFRRIDWKASLRLGELIVREFLREENVEVYIFLDNTREMRKGIRRAKVDYGSTLVLQLASVLLRKYSVGLVVYDDVSARLVRASRSAGQLEVIRQNLGIKRERGLMSLKFTAASGLGERAREFVSKVLPLKKGRHGPSGLVEAFSLLKSPSFVILITDLNNPRDVYGAVSKALRKHRVLILSPNPVLFYSGRLDEKTLERLYRAYEEREKLIRKFNSLVPTIDLGPSDYIKEIARVV